MGAKGSSASLLGAGVVQGGVQDAHAFKVLRITSSASGRKLSALNDLTIRGKVLVVLLLCCLDAWRKALHSFRLDTL